MNQQRAEQEWIRVGGTARGSNEKTRGGTSSVPILTLNALP